MKDKKGFKMYEESELFDKFVIREGNCEASEELSKACIEIIECHDLKKLNDIFQELRAFEIKYPNFILSAIRAKEYFLNNANTSQEVVEKISKGILCHSYIFKYYGGYGGDDYAVEIDLIGDLEEKFVKHKIKVVNKNFEYFKKIKKLKELKKQLELSFEYSGSIDEIQELEEMISFLKKDILTYEEKAA